MKRMSIDFYDQEDWAMNVLCILGTSSETTQTWRTWSANVQVVLPMLDSHTDLENMGTCLRVNRWRPPELIQYMSKKERHSTLVVELLSRGVTFIQHQDNEQLIQPCDRVARHLSRVL